MLINEISKKTGLSKDTIRYYEKIGFFDVSRRNNNYKEYNDESIKIIAFISLGKSLGFTLHDIKEYYYEIFHKKAKSMFIKKILEDKCTEIDEKINDLKKAQIEIFKIIARLNCPE